MNKDKLSVNDETGEVIKCGFGVRHNFEGQKNFDTDYIQVEVIRVAKKVGEGDEDFVLEDKEIVKKVPIVETIQAQADMAGIDAYLKPYLQTGQPLQEVIVNNDEIDDYSDMPEDLAEACALGESMKINFDKLDPRLKGDAKTPEEFISNLTQKSFDDYINSLKPKEEKKGD